MGQGSGVEDQDEALPPYISHYIVDGARINICGSVTRWRVRNSDFVNVQRDFAEQ